MNQLAHKKTYVLIDCNNFFVSCERVFRPDLEGKAVVVLSSNDGCAVSRSNEAKALGIPMGVPAYQYHELFRRCGVVAFSANFELYADISRRILSILSAITPRMEVYSIDESFLDVTELNIPDYSTWGRTVRTDILHCTGVPVSVGIAPTKTLAKLATDIVKKDPTHAGVLDLTSLTKAGREAHMQKAPLENLWGVGRRLGPRLRVEGLQSALDVARLRPTRARQLMGLMGMRMVMELNGVSCHGFAPREAAQQMIMRGRTFGADRRDFDALEAALANLIARATLEARREGRLAQRIALFLSTSKHKPDYRSWHEDIILPMPTADTTRVLAALLKRLANIYRADTAYHRAVITLYDLIPEAALQLDLLGAVQASVHDASRARMAAVDAINVRFGSHTIRYAAEDLSRSWQPKHGSRSPRYVSSWDELPEAYVH